MGAGTAIFQEHLLLPATVHGAVWRFSPPYRKPCHFHGQIEFILIKRGRALIRIGNETYMAHAGQLVWLLPGIEHALIGASHDLDFRVVHIEPDLANELQLIPSLSSGKSSTELPIGAPSKTFSGWVKDLGWLIAGRPVVELKRSDQDKLLEDCDSAMFDDPLFVGTRTLMCRALLNARNATRANYNDRRPNSLIELACCLLLDDPSLERSGLCRSLDVSESYVSRRFQLELGLSFLEQRARIRIAHFVTHVMRKRRSFLEGALLAGFGSYSQLHRVFVRVVGVSPREYLSRGMRNHHATIEEPGVLQL